MGSLCDDTPKPMLPINGKPKLAYSIEGLPEEVTEVILIAGYLKEKIIHYFGDVYKGKNIRYVIEEKVLGTGKVLHKAKDILEDRFLVIMGDDLYRKDDLRDLARHRLALLAMEVEDSSQFGAVKIDNNGNVAEILERPHDPRYRLINTGAYALTREYFSYPLALASKTEYGLPQTMMGMRNKHIISLVRARDWFPIGDPEALSAAQERVRDFL